jgi:hypothetical protein
VTVDASLQTKLSTFTSTAKSRSALNQNISGIQNPKLPDGGGIVAYALNFPALILDAPAIISFESNGYEHVPKFGAFGAVPANRSYFVGNGLVDGLTASLVRVQQLCNQIALLREIYQFYGTSGDTKLTDAASKAELTLDQSTSRFKRGRKIRCNLSQHRPSHRLRWVRLPSTTRSATARPMGAEVEIHSSTSIRRPMFSSAPRSRMSSCEVGVKSMH